MERNLLRILEESKTEKELIVNTVEETKKKRELNPNISIILSDDDISGKETLATYNSSTYDITVFLNNLNLPMQRLERDFKMFDISNELEMGKKITLMQIVLHELEHAYQHKISLDKNNQSTYAILSRSGFEYEKEIENIITNFIKNVPKIKDKNMLHLEELLFKGEINYIILKLYNFYQKNHDLFPKERTAQINSYKIIKNILKDTNYHNLYHYFSAKKIYEETKDYIDSNGQCPLLRYVLGIEDASLLSKLPIFERNEIPLEERLYYGIDLFDEEIEQQKEKIRKHLEKIRKK